MVIEWCQEWRGGAHVSLMDAPLLVGQQAQTELYQSPVRDLSVADPRPRGLKQTLFDDDQMHSISHPENSQLIEE